MSCKNFNTISITKSYIKVSFEDNSIYIVLFNTIKLIEFIPKTSNSNTSRSDILRILYDNDHDLFLDIECTREEYYEIENAINECINAHKNKTIIIKRKK